MRTSFAHSYLLHKHNFAGFPHRPLIFCSASAARFGARFRERIIGHLVDAGDGRIEVAPAARATDDDITRLLAIAADMRRRELRLVEESDQ